MYIYIIYLYHPSVNISEHLQRTCNYKPATCQMTPIVPTPPVATNENLMLMCNRLQVVRDVITPPHTPPLSMREHLHTCKIL